LVDSNTLDREIIQKMEREEFKKQLLEQQIFDELKDGYFGGINYIRCKWEGTGIDHSRVYRRIVNYRIKVYGTSSIPNPTYYNIKTKEERLKESNDARRRRYYQRNKEN
jgi:hypothetical protein